MKQKFTEFLKMLEPSKDHIYTSGMDVADSIALILIMALVCFVIFI
jgi:hypothetical protein